MSSTIVNPGEFLPEITQKDLEEVIVIQKLIRENLSENAFKWWMARMIELHREGSRADILHLRWVFVMPFCGTTVICWRQYIKDIKRLPLMRGMETKPMTSNKAFIASHKIKDLDNLLIRILAMLTDNQVNAPFEKLWAGMISELQSFGMLWRRLRIGIPGRQKGGAIWRYCWKHHSFALLFWDDCIHASSAYSEATL